MKDTSNTPGKTVAIVGLAAVAVGLATYLVLPPTQVPGKKILLKWYHEAPGEVIFEIVSKTNLNSAWRFKTNVVGTNAVLLTADQAQEFFTISKVMDRGDTNISIRQKGF